MMIFLPVITATLDTETKQKMTNGDGTRRQCQRAAEKKRIFTKFWSDWVSSLSRSAATNSE